MSTIGPGERVLYLNPPDYGHYAISAGSGEPWRFAVSSKERSEILLDGAAGPASARHAVLFGDAHVTWPPLFCEAGPTPTRPGFPICLYTVE
ncbi:MAG: hypothetical protein JNK04_08680 [Myxococcales bacterium]|nr:hypothetical protein [Myxococcales bacterium]